jgi:hypothetical protein
LVSAAFVRQQAIHEHFRALPRSARRREAFHVKVEQPHGIPAEPPRVMMTSDFSVHAALNFAPIQPMLWSASLRECTLPDKKEALTKGEAARLNFGGRAAS